MRISACLYCKESNYLVQKNERGIEREMDRRSRDKSNERREANTDSYVYFTHVYFKENYRFTLTEKPETL